MKHCEHHVFEAFTQIPWSYLDAVFHKNVNQLPGVGELGPDIEAVLRRHFQFVGDMAFAEYDRQREAARNEVAALLHARGISI